ncbi:hypothetical protein WJX84_009190 [Apatococcus fuscideae]|uniref:Uncharacterized protein n=1 Tax=Apatococcus fuscideae TaxID=2026836 RepID=A0AAW1TGI6_9CHLO
MAPVRRPKTRSCNTVRSKPGSGHKVAKFSQRRGSFGGPSASGNPVRETRAVQKARQQYIPDGYTSSADDEFAEASSFVASEGSTSGDEAATSVSPAASVAASESEEEAVSSGGDTAGSIAKRSQGHQRRA